MKSQTLKNIMIALGAGILLLTLLFADLATKVWAEEVNVRQ